MDDFHLPITLYKGMRTHPISHFISYDHLSLSFRTFAFFVVFELIPWSYVEAAQVFEWK